MVGTALIIGIAAACLVMLLRYLRDIQVAHPTLEEVFLTYYSDGEGR